MRNDVTNEKLFMALIGDSLFGIGRLPNDIVDWQRLDDYFDSILALPSISIGKWVCFSFFREIKAFLSA